VIVPSFSLNQLLILRVLLSGSLISRLPPSIVCGTVIGAERRRL